MRSLWMIPIQCRGLGRFIRKLLLPEAVDPPDWWNGYNSIVGIHQDTVHQEASNFSFAIGRGVWGEKTGEKVYAASKKQRPHVQKYHYFFIP